ncbi:MAG TPA: FtsX-like permease family protein, partial [Longimicrobiales bacterium]|nr:FtsX-like permease family protein [Longimicrobiales bacterium]
LGVQPMLGRGFAVNEVGPDSPPVIVLTHGLWTRLGGERSIVGRELQLNGQPFTVIGVMPREFAFVRHTSLVKPQAPDAYIPLNVHLAQTNPNNGSFGGLVRVRHGTPPAQATAAVSAVGRMIDERDFSKIGLKLYPVQLHEDLVAGVRPALVVVALAGVFLVLVLMVNLATLLLARATQREQEFAVSRALGANPVAVMRATLVEGGVLGLLGGMAAVLAAVWGTRVLVSLAPMELPRREAIAVDWVVAVIVIGTGVLLGFMAALIPALWAARTPLAALLGNAAVRGGGGHGRMRRSMVVVQVALSLVLLSAGGLVVRSFERLLRADAGFRPEGLLTMRVPIPAQLIPDSLAALAVQNRVHDALAAIPGVSGVSAADALPLSGAANQTSIEIPGAPGNTGQREHDRTLVDYIGVRGGYIEVMGMRVVAGRPLDPMYRAGRFEAVIDRGLADYFFPTGSPIGAKIPFGDPDTLTIVGVVEQARLYDVHRDDRPQVYIRAEDWGYRTLSFGLRSGRPPASLIAEVRTAIRAIDPRLALSDIRTGDQIVNDALRQQRTSAVLIAGFSLGALLLAAMGLFGVVAASVTRRRQEIAVRLALGAEHRRVLRLVIGEGARLVLLGVLIGVPGAYYAGRAISGLLVGIAPTDPLTLAAVGLLLGSVALAACYLPARRVLGIEPARSLRGE